MKNNGVKNQPFIFILAFIFGVMVKPSDVLGQQPTPVIFHPIIQPIKEIYHFQEVGLIAISNGRELQLWDANTKAYFGFIGVLPPHAFNCKIRLVEYIPISNTVAIVWEEYITNDAGKDTVYNDFLSVVSLATLNNPQPIEREGMLAFIKYKYKEQLHLPELNFPEKIYQCFYSKPTKRFLTCDREGLVQVYEEGGFKKSIATTTSVTKVFVADTSGRYLLLVDGITAVVKRINIETGKSDTITVLTPTNSCLGDRYNFQDNLFTASFTTGLNELLLLDSVMRVRTYNVTYDTLDNFLTYNHEKVSNIISGKMDVRDSSGFFIIETKYGCERIMLSFNLRTGVANMFNGGNKLPIISTSYGSDSSSIRLMAGTSEQEIDLKTLSEKPTNFLIPSSNADWVFTGKWENGYVSVFKEDHEALKIMVYKDSSNKSSLLYLQQLYKNKNEKLVGIEPNKKWYITITNWEFISSTGANEFMIYDSTGQNIFSVPVTYPIQVLNAYPFEQRLFSKDGRFLLLKEVISTRMGLDSCRLRVFTTNGFKKVADIRYTELFGGNATQRYTASLTDSSGRLFYIATIDSNGYRLNYLYRYDLAISGASFGAKYRLYFEPDNPTLPFYVKNITIASKEGVLWTGTTINNSVNRQNIYQGIRGMRLNTNEQWGLNIPMFPEIQNVLTYDEIVAIQMDDHIQFYKWAAGYFHYFLTLIPVYNEKTAEVSCLFAAFGKDQNDFVYYEKTGNDDCISFKFGNHSFKRNYFDQSFNRPDLILEKIPGHNEESKILFQNAILKRNERITNKLENFNPSLLPIIVVKNTSYKDDKFVINLAISSKLPIVEIRSTINGTLVKRSVTLKAGETVFTIYESLSMGDNAIEITAVTKNGIEGLPFRMTQTHIHSQKKPELHVLVVSVSEYTDKDAYLPFAVKDGRDMSNLFKHQLSDTLFSDIKVDTLFNKTASDRLVQQWLAGKMKLNATDYVIVFYSGHGLLNKKKELQLATSFTFFDEAVNTIDFANLLKSMDALPARQKLLLIDACHSGDLDKSIITKKKSNKSFSNNIGSDSVAQKGVIVVSTKKNENIFESMQKLFSFSEKGSGTIVFSATGGMQFAFEGAKYQNGYFTYVLKEALLYDKVKESQQGTLWLNQLIKYTIKRVTEISHGNQTPNLRISHPDINWRIK